MSIIICTIGNPGCDRVWITFTIRTHYAWFRLFNHFLCTCYANYWYNIITLTKSYNLHFACLFFSSSRVRCNIAYRIPLFLKFSIQLVTNFILITWCPSMCDCALHNLFRTSPLPCFFLDFEENLRTNTSQPISYCAGGLAAFMDSTILLAVVFELEFAKERICCVAFMCLSTKLTLSSVVSCCDYYY